MSAQIKGNVQYTTLGKTGLKVSRLGFGCMRLPMEGGKVVREKAIPLLRRAVDLGITYFDTGINYCNHDSQRVMGEALEDLRDRVILSTKNHHYDKNDERAWWTNLEDSLRRLRTDYIDVYSFHGLSWEKYVQHVDGPDGQLKWMLRAREQGMIHHICCSFHDTADNLKKLASTGHFEAVTLQYNILDRSNEPAFRHVTKGCGMGIVVMGPVGGGRLGGESEEIRRMIPGSRSVPEVALRFVLSNPYVSVALSGMENLNQLEQNIAAASRKTPLTAAEKRRLSVILRRFQKLSELYCTGCKYCMPCPSGVDIAGNFMALNYARVYGLPDVAKRAYGRLRSEQAAYCVACGKCLPKCPQHIEIVRQLRETVRRLDDAYGHVVARVAPLRLKAFRKSGRRRAVALGGSINFKNLSDEPVTVRATFAPSKGTAVHPAEIRATIQAFGRKSVPLQIQHQFGAHSDTIRTGLAVAGAKQTDLIDAEFRIAFAPRTDSSGAGVRRVGPAIKLEEKAQLLRGTARVLKKHGATVQFAYDDEALYVTASVRDDMLAPAVSGQPWRTTDHLVLFIDARPAALLGRPGSLVKGTMIYFSASGRETSVSARVLRPGGARQDLVACKGRITADGYRVHAAISWKLLGLRKPTRKHLGVQLQLGSHDRRRTRNVEMSWTGTQLRDQHAAFGHLFLLE